MIKHFNTLWLVVVAALLLLLAFNPTLVSRESISQLLGQLGTSALVVYILLSLTRALIMIPSTPFILAGAISFPEMPILIFVISYIGVVVGTLLIYSFPAFGNYDEYLESKYPKHICVINGLMQVRYSFLFFLCWSFFPLLPSVLIFYVACIA